MILITGASGFVGRRLSVKLAGDGQLKVRVLLREEAMKRHFPDELPLDVRVGTLTELDTIRPVLEGVHTIFHLVGSDMRGRHGSLAEVDIVGTKALVEA